MGGSGGWKFEPGDTAKLGKLVAENIKPADAGVRRNVFISFSTTDLTEVHLLRGQAKNERSSLEFNDWSLQEPFDSENAEYIRRGIKERIRQSSVTLVFVGSDTHRSQWVDWEIRASHEMGKKVIAMYSGSKPRHIPAALNELGVTPVAWSHAAIQQAIDGP